MDFINYAHRGASEYAPENTLAAFYLGLQMGANGIETDIQRTKDGELVLFHDGSLRRILGMEGAIGDHTWPQLARLDFGAYKGVPLYQHERLVKLDTFLHHFGGKPLSLALEIKQEGIAREVVDAVDAHGIWDRVVLTSFHWDSLVAARACAPHAAMGFLTQEITAAVLDDMEALCMGQICPRADLMTEEACALARWRGFSIRAWGVKTEALMHRALALGVDGMTVNFPDLLARALEA